MIEIPTKYEPSEKEDKWYKYWMDNNFFRSTPDDREPYSIAIPPPNVTGVLHMGHMLNNTIQDVLVRRARMQGKNACWVPGTDHASIATEAKVVAKLKSEGIDKATLSRDDFMKHAWEWKEKHGGIILEQLKKLGASCDWERTKFTMDKDMSESVIKVFIDLFEKGLIYRGIRMVNWDPQAKTAVSDEEVIHKEENSKLYYVKYKIAGKDDWLTIATTRPETILGDTAICIHPKDERYTQLHGQNVIIPLIEREVPIILDEYVDREFGTGCLKVTPAHDIHDYELGIKHKLDSIDIFDDEGKLNESAQLYIGEDRFDAREKIVADLEAKNHIVKIEDYQNKIGRSERTNAVIEPKLSMQWFLKMEELAKPALDVVMNDDIKLHPSKYKNTYRHWMENVRDWCISRQLWWGHRIPAYYLPNSNDFVVADNKEKALELAKLKTGNQLLTIADLKQEEDVVDTWFSSWLWPISVFDGINNPENEDINYYYPTNDLVTAPEILFFWVARMIIAGFEYQDKKPFNNVYLTGIVRDKQRRKMSKSLGNSPDPIELMKKHGADGVRVGMLLCSPAGGDLLFDESLTEQGRNFANKIWNAFRLVKTWTLDENIAPPESSVLAVEWFNDKLNESIATLNKQFADYRISEALMSVYKLFWDDFASWYLEIIKPAYEQPIDKKTYNASLGIFDKLLKILHPFMPFISEEIWQLLEERNDGESIMNTMLPVANTANKALLKNFEISKDAISSIRKVRADKQIPMKEKLQLLIKSGNGKYSNQFDSVLLKLANLSEIQQCTEKPDGAVSFIIGTTEYFVPLKGKVNVEEELEKLQKELDYQTGFHNTVSKKLSNERFVNNAPVKVVENERQKQADAESKIKSLKEQIKGLS